MPTKDNYSSKNNMLQLWFYITVENSKDLEWNRLISHGRIGSGDAPDSRLTSPSASRLPNFKKPCRRKHILPGLALAQKIDAEIGRDHQADRADRRQQHHIHREMPPAPSASVPRMVPPGQKHGSHESVALSDRSDHRHARS